MKLRPNVEPQWDNPEYVRSLVVENITMNPGVRMLVGILLMALAMVDLALQCIYLPTTLTFADFALEQPAVIDSGIPIWLLKVAPMWVIMHALAGVIALGYAGYKIMLGGLK